MNYNLKFICFSILAFVIGCSVFFLFLFFIKNQAAPKPEVLGGSKENIKTSQAETAVKKFEKPKEHKPRGKKEIITFIEEELEPEEYIEEEPSLEEIKAFAAFLPEDLEDKQKMVYMDIGNYDVDTGEEFEISIRVDAPALVNFSLMMEFNQEFIEYVSDSAKAVGKMFRYGIEFYAQNDKGRMILISKGHPGAKQTEKVEDRPVAVFRMKAKQSGITKINFSGKGIILLDPFGGKLEYDVKGGVIEIR